MAINWFTFFAQIVNFLIVVVLLWRFLYRPVVSVMKERETQIAAEFKKAEELAQEAGKEAEAARIEREKIEEQRTVLLQEAAIAADQRRVAMIDEARAEVDATQQSWFRALEHEKQRFLLEVRTRMGGTVYNLARDALADLANADLEQAIAASFLWRLEERLSADEGVYADEAKSDGIIVVRSSFALSPEMQDEIGVALAEASATGAAGARTPEDPELLFEVAPELICGIEAQVRSRRIAWNIRDYLDSYADQLDATLVREMNAQREPGEHGEQEASADTLLEA